MILEYLVVEVLDELIVSQEAQVQEELLEKPPVQEVKVSSVLGLLLPKEEWAGQKG
jgi:hypothetical protein